MVSVFVLNLTGRLQFDLCRVNGCILIFALDLTGLELCHRSDHGLGLGQSTS